MMEEKLVKEKRRKKRKKQKNKNKSNTKETIFGPPLHLFTTISILEFFLNSYHDCFSIRLCSFFAVSPFSALIGNYGNARFLEIIAILQKTRK
jgi:hypothetical protein